MPKLLSREEFDAADLVVKTGLNVYSWEQVLGKSWASFSDQTMYEKYINYYLTHCTKLGKLISGVDE